MMVGLVWMTEARWESRCGTCSGQLTDKTAHIAVARGRSSIVSPPHTINDRGAVYLVLPPLSYSLSAFLLRLSRRNVIHVQHPANWAETPSIKTFEAPGL